MNLYHAFGCYLMSLMSLNIFVLRNFQRLWNCQFLIFLSTFSLFSVQTDQILFIVEFIQIFLLYCFERTVSWLWYYEFSYKILYFLCTITHFCWCFCFFGKLSQYLTIYMKISMTKIVLKHFFIFLTYGLDGCDTVLLQNLVEFFSFLFLQCICSHFCCCLLNIG